MTLKWEMPEDFPGHYIAKGKECDVWLSPRPGYCDRGNWLAQLEARGNLAREIDEADGWPRYYFDLQRAKLEIEAWLAKRGQMPDPGPPAVHVLRYGYALCGMPGVPGEWPEGHRWIDVNEWALATCVPCRVVAGRVAG